MLLFDGPRQHDGFAGTPCTSAKPSCVGTTPASRRSAERSRPISTRRRARCDSTRLARKSLRDERASRHISPATPRPMPAQARTAPDAGPARRPCLADARHGDRRRRPAPSTSSSASTSWSSRGLSSPCAIRRAAGAFKTCEALSTSTVNAGISASRAACPARASAVRAVFVFSRRRAIPATTRS